MIGNKNVSFTVADLQFLTFSKFFKEKKMGQFCFINRVPVLMNVLEFVNKIPFKVMIYIFYF